jgi:hypothetical protein
MQWDKNENVKEDRAAYCPIFLFNAWEGCELHSISYSSD